MTVKGEEAPLIHPVPFRLFAQIAFDFLAIHYFFFIKDMGIGIKQKKMMMI